jgi:hypothetical protein
VVHFETKCFYSGMCVYTPVELMQIDLKCTMLFVQLVCSDFYCHELVHFGCPRLLGRCCEGG